MIETQKNMGSHLSSLPLIAFFLSLLLFLSACTERNIRYLFDASSVKCEWGKLGPKLKGTEKKAEGISEIGAPYKLLIWFESPTTKYDKVVVNGFSLSNRETGAIVYEKAGKLEEKFAPEDRGVGAIFLFNNINVEHTDYILKVNYTLFHNGKKTTYDTSINFEAKYDEFRSNPFWDRLMSV